MKNLSFFGDIYLFSETETESNFIFEPVIRA